MIDKNTEIKRQTPSLLYVEAMRDGWNLGNTFDSFSNTEDKEEESWYNPKVTKELIQTVKEKGYKNIRLPLTLHMRIGSAEDNYRIRESFLDRYEQVVKWSLEEDLMVMINVHHDSITWLKEWNGDKDSELFTKYIRIWEQLADRFKAYDKRVMFESINEPQIYKDEETSLDSLRLMNDTFYQIIRLSGGNNADRMLILPTLLTDHTQERMDKLLDQMLGFNDENLIATIHYYSDWIYSANLGKTRFDQVLWDDVTPRTSLINTFDRIEETFVDKGIGVIIGEYGLLGYDKSDYANQFGETIKYLEFINYYAKQKGFSLILWDNGQHLNRYTYDWHVKRFGEIIETSMKERSSYSEGLDTIYLFNPVLEEGLSIPLILNGNTFEQVSVSSNVLIEGEDYRYEKETLHLTGNYLNRLFNETGGKMGTRITLIPSFSAGSDWHHHLIYTDEPVLKESNGRVGAELTIPILFNGNHLETVLVKNKEGKVIANNTHWEYLQHSVEYAPDYENDAIRLLPEFSSHLEDDDYTITLTFFSGYSSHYLLKVRENEINGKPM